jgi:hypothetical protein
VGGGGPLLNIVAEKGDITLRKAAASQSGGTGGGAQPVTPVGNCPAAATPLRVVFFT